MSDVKLRAPFGLYNGIWHDSAPACLVEPVADLTKETHLGAPSSSARPALILEAPLSRTSAISQLVGGRCDSSRQSHREIVTAYGAMYILCIGRSTYKLGIIIGAAWLKNAVANVARGGLDVGTNEFALSTITHHQEYHQARAFGRRS